MMKYALLAGAMMVAAPAIAQRTPTTLSTDQTAPIQSQSYSPSMTSDAAPADAATSPQTTTTTSQIAHVVEADFPKYDGDGNGKLSATEFASWMGTLRASSDPTAKADNAEMKAWSKTAFAQADVDKSKSISKGELTTFLAKGQG